MFSMSDNESGLLVGECLTQMTGSRAVGMLVILRDCIKWLFGLVFGQVRGLKAWVFYLGRVLQLGGYRMVDQCAGRRDK